MSLALHAKVEIVVFFTVDVEVILANTILHFFYKISLLECAVVQLVH